MAITIYDAASEPKRHHSTRAARLVHEHYGMIMAFAHSRLPLQQLVDERFLGEWKYLHKALFEIPEEKATRALMELCLYIRAIDDDEKFTALRGNTPFGEVVDPNGSRTQLLAREVANKIIHAERYEWSRNADPAVICLASKDQSARYKWASASISLVALGAICGSLMS